MKRKILRILSLVTVLAMLCCLTLSAFASGTGGEASARTLGKWRDMSVPRATMRTAINAQTLYPQRTGWDKLDKLMDSFLSQGGTDAYSKLRYMYNWLITNVQPHWEGYSVTSPSLAAYNSVNKYDYLSAMTFEEGLQKSVPDDMVNRAYHLLATKRGADYDYAITFALLARYVGIESYVRTGGFDYEDETVGFGHHGWCVLVLDGQEYIFDPQRDSKNPDYKYDGTDLSSDKAYYFGVDPEKVSWRYVVRYYAVDTAANEERDAQMLPVEASRSYVNTLTVSAEAHGTTDPSGSVAYPDGGSATLTAIPDEGYGFLGWYNRDDELVSRENPYTVTMDQSIRLTAKFGQTAKVTLLVEGTGSATGSGEYPVGSQVALSAHTPAGGSFLGWYSASGNLLSVRENTTLLLERDTTLTARFQDMVVITAQASRSGVVTGGGAVEAGSQVTLAAVPRSLFSGWYDAAGTLLSKDPTYSLTAEKNTTVYALFDDDLFVDLPDDAWYLEDAIEAARRGLVNGTSAITFSGEIPFSRAMAVTMLYRLDQGNSDILSLGAADPDAAVPFQDVPEGEWYSEAVRWAYQYQVVNGVSATSFAPNQSVTRQDFFTMAVRYLNQIGIAADDSVLPYGDADKVSSYALSPVSQAQAMGLIKGDDAGNLRPLDVLSRAEGATFLVRIARYLESFASRLDITYDPNGGEYVPSEEENVYPTARREGYTFAGWYTQPTDGELLTPELEKTLHGDVTVYARWEKIPVVTWDPNGGTLDTEPDANQQPTAVREGYTFAGWYTAAEGGEEFTPDAQAALAEDITVYAHWTAIENPAIVTDPESGLEVYANQLTLELLPEVSVEDRDILLSSFNLHIDDVKEDTFYVVQTERNLTIEELKSLIGQLDANELVVSALLYVIPSE